MRTIQKALAVAACATALVGSGATSASAGEITGNYQPNPVAGQPPLKGRDLPVNGRSICAFSGRNDGALDPSQQEGPEDTARTQTPARVGSFTGFACNPNNGFGE